MSAVLIRADDGTESVRDSGEGIVLTEEQIARSPTKNLLGGLGDGIWIRVGSSFYRNDLGMWLIGSMHPDPGMRFNAVSASWIAKTHSGEPVFRLSR